MLPTGGLEPPIFGLGDRRLIHWATRADVSSRLSIIEVLVWRQIISRLFI
jgi:hypothetical protein